VPANKHPGTEDVDQSHRGLGTARWKSMILNTPGETVVMSNWTWSLS